MSLYADGDVLAAFADSDLVIDCLLGIGSTPPVRGSIGKMLREVTGLVEPFRIACDIPSGTDADTGAADDVAFNADLTIAAGPAKVGTSMYPARGLSGRVVETDIGLSPAALEELPGRVLVARREAAALPQSSPGQPQRLVRQGGRTGGEQSVPRGLPRLRAWGRHDRARD